MEYNPLTVGDLFRRQDAGVAETAAIVKGKVNAGFAVALDNRTVFR